MTPDQLTTTDAARELGKTPRTILNWITSGKITATQPVPGRTNPYVIPRSEIDRLKTEAGTP